MLANLNKDASGQETTEQLHAESEHGLRATRELQQLTVDDVANVLHLSREHIVALETGDFARLGPQVFVRGYLRSYARLLGLPEQSVLADFPLGDMVQEEFQTMSLPADLKPGFYLRAWMGWAMLGLLLLIGGLIFLANSLDTDNDRAAIENNRVAEQSVPLSGEPPAASKATGNTATRPRFTIVESSLESASPALSQVSSATVDSDAGLQTTTEAEAQSAPNGLTADSQAETVVPLAVPVATETLPAAGPATGKVRLTLSFSDECWVEIADSQRSLLYGLEKRGAVVNLDGVPPFRLFFGNRNAVQIAFAGKPFVIPVRASDSGNTARFTIKEEQLQ